MYGFLCAKKNHNNSSWNECETDLMAIQPRGGEKGSAEKFWDFMVGIYVEKAQNVSFFYVHNCAIFQLGLSSNATALNSADNV